MWVFEASDWLLMTKKASVYILDWCGIRVGGLLAQGFRGREKNWDSGQRPDRFYKEKADS